MYPGQRRMPKYGFSETQIDDIIAFLRWIGKLDLNGFPAKPPLQAAAQAASTQGTNAGAPQPQVFSSICTACHMLGGKGGNVGPALDQVYKRLTREQMIAWLRDPQTIKPGTAMPKLPLNEEQLVELADYLQGLGGH